MRTVTCMLFLGILLVSADIAQAQRPASPPGEAATQIGGEYQEEGGRTRYVGGKWVVVTYSRPILRGRTNIFGEGENYGQAVNAGAPVWRAGANQSTRLTADMDLTFGQHTLPAGEYSLFVDLKGPDNWELIVSNHKAQAQYQVGEGLWGAYGYDPSKDAFRVPMTVEQTDIAADQLTYVFTNMTQSGGTLVLWWGTTVGSVNFRLAE